jgi:cobalt/nickel transport system ATP-binding protein
LADRPIHTLSLGERRRVALAGVLVMRPEIILLDEPTANLDRRARVALRALLEHASDDRRAVCLATHDTTFAWAWATRVVVLERGRILAEGPTQVILRDSALLSRAELDAPRQDLWHQDAPTTDSANILESEAH